MDGNNRLKKKIMKKYFRIKSNKKTIVPRSKIV
jgi:hypothetical protein